MKIKEIFDEIRLESGTNLKMEILKKYSKKDLLKEVLYNTYSNKIKYHIKQIPEYSPNSGESWMELSSALIILK